MAWKGRYLILAFDCMLVIGIYFCTDIPSALQAQIEGQPTTNCSESLNQTCCEDCLGLGADKYNLLYTIFSWTSSALILPVGFLIDRIGNKRYIGAENIVTKGEIARHEQFLLSSQCFLMSSAVVSALIFTGIATSGSLVFAVASLPSIRGTPYMFPLMMCGRLLLGAGTGSSRIVRDRVIASWFPDRLALAFGIAVSTMGIGSVLTFILTSNMPRWIGLCSTLFVGAAVCSTCFLSAICLCCLDWYGTKYHPQSVVAIKGKTKFTCSSIKQLPTSFVAICVMVACYYSFQLPFTANGSKFIQDRYGYTKTDSSYINGVVYDVSVVLSPFVGLFLDKIGNRGWVAFFGALSTIPAGPLLLFTNMPPLVGYIWIGVSFTVTVVSLWSSIPHVVPHRLVGSANGIASCLLDLTVGVTSIAIGQIMSKSSMDDSGDVTTRSWGYVFLILFGHAGICAVAGLVLNLTCGRKERKVNGKSSLRRKTSSPLGPVHCDNASSSEEESVGETKETVFTITGRNASIVIENSAVVDWLKYHHNNNTVPDNAEKTIPEHLTVSLAKEGCVNISAVIIVLPDKDGTGKTDKDIVTDSGSDNTKVTETEKDDVYKEIDHANGLYGCAVHPSHDNLLSRQC